MLLVVISSGGGGADTLSCDKVMRSLIAGSVHIVEEQAAELQTAPAFGSLIVKSRLTLGS